MEMPFIEPVAIQAIEESIKLFKGNTKELNEEIKQAQIISIAVSLKRIADALEKKND